MSFKFKLQKHFKIELLGSKGQAVFAVPIAKEKLLLLLKISLKNLVSLFPELYFREYRGKPVI
jgi:hypothetical protein